MDARLRSSSQSPEVATAERTRVFTPPFQSLVFVFFHSLFSRFQLLLLPMTFLVGRNHQWLHHHHHRRHLKRPHLRADTALEQAATLLFASAPVHISPCCLFPTWHTFTYAKHNNISSFSSSFSIFFLSFGPAAEGYLICIRKPQGTDNNGIRKISPIIFF